MTSAKLPFKARILVADDNPDFLQVMEYNLSGAGAEVVIAATGTEALAKFGLERFDLVLADVRMPGLDGMALLQEMRALNSSIPVILITAHGDIEMAVEAMQVGAADFLPKPFKRARLLEKVSRALKLEILERENRALREELITRFSFENMVGSSPAMRALFDLMARVTMRDTTVLILGESGTGKELVARALHYGGPRRKGRFVPVNCAAIPASLLESELFGHVKGAFTGAESAREGRFQAASGGTLFLDEVGDMPLELQAKLLRALQERQIEPVGSNRPVPTDVRIIAATHQDLSRMVREGKFRQDLFYRLNVVQLPVPPLRDRIGDLPLLVRYFLRHFGEPDLVVEPGALEKLERHPWPGNVRELENTIERALALRAHPDRITGEDIFLSTMQEALNRPLLQEVPEGGIVLDEVEKQLVISAYAKSGGNQTRAAQLLGITRQQLIYRLHKYGI